MEDATSTEGTSSSQATGESSESTIEINIKTLDSQTYTFRVNKDMPVPKLKEMLVNVTGLPVEQQRLIFRGKVLKDADLLSEYHLEDGHTLHLVARQPVQAHPTPGPGSEGTAQNNNSQGNDSATGAPRNRVGQVSHSVVLGTVNIADQGESMVTDISRLIGSVLSSLGVGTLATTGGASNTAPGSVPNQVPSGAGAEGTQGGNVRSQPGGSPPPAFTLFNRPLQLLPQTSQFPPNATLSRHMVMPDSLTTLSEFISRMEIALQIGSQSPPVTNVRDPSRSGTPPLNIHGIPTLESLALVMERAQQLLSGNAAAALSHVASRLQREGTSADSVLRSQIQNEAMHVGLTMQHLGAMLLELGRTIMTLHMAQSPAESSVNTGPAVYISPTGPNPIMVQPFPLQTASLFGVPSPLVGGVSGPFASGDPSRNINIHIHAGNSVAPGVSTGMRASSGEAFHAETQNVEQASTNGNDSGVVGGDDVNSQAGNSADAQESESAPVKLHTPGISMPGSEGPQFQLEALRSPNNADLRTVNMEESLTSSSMGSSTVCQSNDTHPIKSSVETSDSIVRVHAQSSQGGESGRPAPLGLGLGGLQPKRRSKSTKPVRKDEVLHGSHLTNLNQQSVTRGQEFLHSLASQNSDMNRGNANDPSIPLSSLVGQFMNSMPLEGQGSGGQVDAPNMMSHVLQSPAFNSLLTGVATQTGVSSPADLRSMLQQLTESPGVKNALNEMVQQVEGQNQDLEGMLSGLGRGQGGIDFSRIIQQMMPVVSQALGRGSTRSAPTNGVQPEPQTQQSDGRTGGDGMSHEVNSQIDLHHAVERIEQHDAPRDVFRAVLESAYRLYGEGNNYEELVGELGDSVELTSEFIGMLARDVRRRLQDKS